MLRGRLRTWGTAAAAAGVLALLVASVAGAADGLPFTLGLGNSAGGITSLDSTSASRGLSVTDAVASATAIYGDNGASGGSGTGVYGRSTSTGGNATGVFGEVPNGSGSYSSGVKGVNDASGFGGFGVYGFSPNNWSGYFQGSVNVVGTLYKSSGAFRIDNPLDPAHSYLQHSFVESPDMMNVYNGNVRTDAKGFATVKLASWFQALNKDYRYQLTVLGRSFADAIVYRKITDGRFTIETSRPHVKVSWQVTGIRHDAYARRHRLPVVVAKDATTRGKYLHPEEYGKPMTKSVVDLPRLAEHAS